MRRSRAHALFYAGVVVAGCLKSQDGEHRDGGVEGRGAVYDSDRKSIFLAVVSD